MALDFPASPTVGQSFTAAGVTWVWDGTKWAASGLSVAYLPLAGGTMSGPIVLAADPAVALQAATKQYVDNGQFGGFVNKLRNGTFDVWQRGNTINNPGVGAYTADGWQSGGTGTVPASVGQNSSRLNYGLHGLTVNGATGNTQQWIAQRIESSVIAPLAGRRVTFQAYVYNGTASTVTPALLTQIPTAPDNFAGVTTDLAQTNLQSIPASSGAVVANTFNVGATAANGYMVYLMFPAGISAGAVTLADADLRVTPGVPVGLNANPQPPELRPIAVELAFCQRYYETSYSNGIAPGTPSVTAGGGFFLGGLPSLAYQAGYWAPFRVTKRAIPSILFYSHVTGAGTAIRDQLGNVDIQATTSIISVVGFQAVTAVVMAAHGGVSIGGNWTASAEL